MFLLLHCDQDTSSYNLKLRSILPGSRCTLSLALITVTAMIATHIIHKVRDYSSTYLQSVVS